MNLSDFRSIRFFTPDEVERTGANIADVKLDLMVRLDNFRHYIGVPVHLLHNGLTTGNHKSKLHPGGRAADVTAPAATPLQCFKAALITGFRGIGTYYNGAAHSYHLDLRSRYGFWTGIKSPSDVAWTFHGLTLDEKILEKLARSRV